MARSATADLEARVAALAARLPRVRRLVVGFSGGPDSTALLLTAARGSGPWCVEALHVDHSLSPESGAWAEHCAQVSAALEVEFVSRQVRVVRAGDGEEAAARRARFAAFEAHLDSETLLLLAQHREDQAETFLQRALRGSGPAGLGAMTPLRSLGAGWLGRPFLDVPREALAQEVRAAGLPTIDDPMNDDLRLERGHLRRRVLPELRERRQGLDAALARTAELCRESGEMLDWFADRELACRLEDGGRRFSLAGFAQLPDGVQRLVLRAWLAALGQRAIPRVRLEAFRKQLGARPDAAVALELDGLWLRRYRDELFATDALAVPTGWSQVWRGPHLELPADCGALEWRHLEDGGLMDPGIEPVVRFRDGGERLPLPDGRGHRTLKALLQARGVPPWERLRLPLLEHEGELMAVPGVFASPRWEALLAARCCQLRLVRPVRT
ncbi:MAG: tRNA lysidine(34) synthetase TilS [Pseudomonadota bacterium]